MNNLNKHIYDERTGYNYTLFEDARSPYAGSRYRRAEHETVDGHRRTVTIFRAHDLYRQYVGEVPPGYQVHHINCLEWDDRVENLRLLTKEQHTELHRRLALQDSAGLSVTYKPRYRNPWAISKWTCLNGKKKDKVVGRYSSKEGAEMAKVKMVEQFCMEHPEVFDTENLDYRVEA